MKWIFSILILLVSSVCFGQGFSYSYVDPCSKKTKTIYISGNQNVTVNYLGYINTFNRNDFQNGAFEGWIQSVQIQAAGKPCDEMKTQTQKSQNMFIAQNLISTLTSVTAASTMTIASTSSNALSNSVGNASNETSESPKSNKKDKNDKNNNTTGNQTNNSSNQTSGQNSGSVSTSSSTGGNTNQTGGNNTNTNQPTQNGNQPTQPTVGQGQNNTGTNPTNNPSSSSANGGSNSPKTEGNSTNNGQNSSQSGQNNPPTQNNSGSNSPKTDGNSTNNQPNTGNVAQNNPNSGSNSPKNEPQTGNSSQTSQNGSNTSSTNSSVNNGSNTGNSGGSGSGGNGQQGNTQKENIKDNKTESSGSGNAISNSVSNAAEASSGSGSGGSKSNLKVGSIIGTGDIVAIRSQEDGSNQFRGTMSVTKSNTDNTRAKGSLLNFTTTVNNTNLTFYGAFSNKKKTNTLIFANSSMVDRDWNFFNTTTTLESKRFNKLSVMGGLNFTIGALYNESFTNLSGVVGGFYPFKASKKLSGNILVLGVYSPFTKFYEGKWWSSGWLVVPFSSWDYTISKNFKYNVSFSGTYEFKGNFLQYQILTGGKIML